MPRNFPFSNLKIRKFVTHWQLETGDWKLSSGYTLIEILVGLTIVALLFGIGYINFRDFARRQEVADIGKQIKGDISLAQQLALSGQKPDEVGCNNPNFLNGYDFIIVSTSGPGEYAIAADCTGGIVRDPYYKDVKLPTDLSISSSSLNSVSFKVLGQGTNIPQGGSVDLTVTQNTTNHQVVTTIGAGGEVQ